MRAAVDEKGRQAVAKRRRPVVDGEHGERQVAVLVVLATVGEGAQCVTDDALARSTLAVVFLWYAEPTMRHEPQPLAEARNT